MGLEPTTTGRKASAAVYVIAPDAATHEKLWARYRALMPALDDQLVAITATYIREHCGIDVPIQPRT